MFLSYGYHYTQSNLTQIPSANNKRQAHLDVWSKRSLQHFLMWSSVTRAWSPSNKFCKLWYQYTWGSSCLMYWNNNTEHSVIIMSIKSAADIYINHIFHHTYVSFINVTDEWRIPNELALHHIVINANRGYLLITLWSICN